MYIGLSIIKELYCADVVALQRKFLSDLPLMHLRESVLFLLNMITDLSNLPQSQLQSGTPLCEMLQRAFLDSLYFGSSNRPSKFYCLCF